MIHVNLYILTIYLKYKYTSIYITKTKNYKLNKKIKNIATDKIFLLIINLIPNINLNL